MADELIALGPDTAARALSRIRASRSDRHWRISLARALRSVTDERVQRWQRDAIGSEIWPIRAYAAVGLGRTGDAAFRSAARQRLDVETHPGARLGVLWGLAAGHDARARADLADDISRLRPTPDIRVDLLALDAISELKLVDRLAFVRARLGHENPFVLRAALDAVDALLDRTSFALIVPLVEHELSFVRDRAVDVLRRFTGMRHHTKRRAFERWCREHCLPEWARPRPSSVTP